MADRLTPERRSALMRKIKGKNTGLELSVFRALKQCCIDFDTHCSELPGKPDIVFVDAKVAIFIESDFWHGWHFPRWRHTLPPYWQAKIEQNRLRDRRSFAKLRYRGWRVLRIWGHDIKADLRACVAAIILASGRRKRSRRRTRRPVRPK